MRKRVVIFSLIGLLIGGRVWLGHVSLIETLFFLLILMIAWRLTRDEPMREVSRPTLGITLGDLNGISLQIALESHGYVLSLAQPYYYGNRQAIYEGALRLGMEIPKDFHICDVGEPFSLRPQEVCGESGKASYDAFIRAIHDAKEKKVDAIVTLPIHKEAWMKGGIAFKGHTDVLRHETGHDAIMMLGCEEMWVALFSEHCSLKEVAPLVTYERMMGFFQTLHTTLPADEKIGVLALNPHAGDGGVLGNEEEVMTQAIRDTNNTIGGQRFYGPLVPDTAFTPHNRQKFRYYVAMYHDQGLIPLKALYFEESVNMSLGLPIIRLSVDHGTAFDKAYTHESLSLKSYRNAVFSACQKVKLCS